MKTLTVVIFFLAFARAVLGQEPLKPIAPKFKPDPIVVEGKIEGIVPLTEVSKSKGQCEGFGSNQPNYVLPLKASFAYLNLKVKGEGLVLLVEGPDGIFCRSDNPELAGMWKAGIYQIWIGTKQKSKSKYRLSLSESNQ